MDAGWGVVVGGVLTALGGAIVMILRARSEANIKEAEVQATINAKNRKDSIDEWKDLCTSLQAQVERHETVASQAAKAIEALQEENAECREDAAEQRAISHFIYGQLGRLSGILKDEFGRDPGPLPELPRPKARRSDDQAQSGAFLANQVAQSVQLLKESDKVLNAQVPPTTVAENPPGKGAQ